MRVHIAWEDGLKDDPDYHEYIYDYLDVIPRVGEEVVILGTGFIVTKVSHVIRNEHGTIFISTRRQDESLES